MHEIEDSIQRVNGRHRHAFSYHNLLVSLPWAFPRPVGGSSVGETWFIAFYFQHFIMLT